MRHAMRLVCLVIIASALGCGSASSPRTAVNKADYFREKQQPTMTPNGKIKPESVKEAEAGKVQYETEDGKKWKVDMTPDGSGGYRYGNPEAAK